MNILIVEDEKRSAETIREAALSAGADRVTHVATMGEAEGLLRVQSWNFVILDLVLPDGDGYTLARRCIEGGIPFLIVSSRTLPMDVVLGLEMGAEDYVKKPVSREELAARILHVLKRTYPLASSGGLRIGDLVIDKSKGRITQKGVIVDLTPTEERILFRLAEAGGAYCSTEELIRTVWGDTPPADGPLTIRVNVRRLRRKVEPDAATPRYILNKWGAGYRLATEIADATSITPDSVD